MQRLHVNLQVADLDASARFYSGLFDAEPTVRKDDYAKWMLDDPRVNFSIVARGGEPGFGHLGIQAETPEELAELRRRIGRLSEDTDQDASRVDDEGQTVCCYHRSDKTWVSDDQGVAWEAFHTSGTSDTFDSSDTFDDGYEAAPGSAAGCCSPADPCGCGDKSTTAATPETDAGEASARCCS